MSPACRSARRVVRVRPSVTHRGGSGAVRPCRYRDGASDGISSGGGCPALARAMCQPPCVHAAQDRVNRRDHRRAVEGLHDAVESAQGDRRAGGRAAVVREPPQDAVDPSHRHGRVEVVPRDVADGQGEGVGGEPDGVVPVPADLRRRVRRMVEGGDRETADGRRGRQEALLQRECLATDALQLHRPAQRSAHLLEDVPQQGEVGLVRGGLPRQVAMVASATVRPSTTTGSRATPVARASRSHRTEASESPSPGGPSGGKTSSRASWLSMARRATGPSTKSASSGGRKAARGQAPHAPETWRPVRRRAAHRPRRRPPGERWPRHQRARAQRPPPSSERPPRDRGPRVPPPYAPATSPAYGLASAPPRRWPCRRTPPRRPRRQRAQR